MLKFIRITICCLLAFIAVISEPWWSYHRFFPVGVAAQDYEWTFEHNGEVPSIVSDGVQYPDWNQLTFSDFGAIESSGSVDLSELSNNVDLDRTITWNSGDRITDIFTLGSFEEAAIGTWTFEQVRQEAIADFHNASLDDYGILNYQNIASLSYAIPGLNQLKLDQVQPIYDAVAQAYGTVEAYRQARKAIDFFAAREQFAKLDLSGLDLSQYEVDSIPHLNDTRLGDLSDWTDAKVSDVPGLDVVPIAKFVGGISSAAGAIAKIDIVFGEKEANRVNTVTGSYEEGFNVPCEQLNCAHLELADRINLGFAFLKGKQWISGISQQVKGGFGILGLFNDGKEPTGRHPFGPIFKVVLTETTESEGRAGFSVYFRICRRIAFVKTCTPYFLGPFPWFTQYEKDDIFLGIDGVDAPLPKGTNVPTLPPDAVPPELQTGYPEDTDYGYYDPTVEVSADDCRDYNSVNMGAFRQAMALAESNDNYYAVGSWVCASGLCGRALGKYQFMSYKEFVQQHIQAQPGGAEFLDRLRNNTITATEASGLLETYFPAQVQEQFWRGWDKMLIDRAVSHGAWGEEIVRLAGRLHNGGEYGDPTKGHYNVEGSEAYNHGEKVLGHYSQVRKKIQNKCSAGGQCRGQLVSPMKEAVATSEWGVRIHPTTGEYRQHAGIDLGVNGNVIGAPVYAADGGIVVTAYGSCIAGNSRCNSGYGNLVVIEHCDGTVTRYAHLHKVRVKQGQKVAQGQLIGGMGTTGVSTGPHLHFEVWKPSYNQQAKSTAYDRAGNMTVNPRNVVLNLPPR